MADQRIDIPSMDTLERNVGKSATFLLALGKRGVRSAVRAALVRDEDVARGSALVVGLLPPREPAPTRALPPAVAAKEAAIGELVSLDEHLLAVVPVVAATVSPVTARWLVEELRASDRPGESISTVLAVLKRLDLLEQGQAPAGTDARVVDALEGRGVGRGERKRLRGLVETALADVPDRPEPEGVDDETRLATLVELKRWYDMVSTLVRRSPTKKSVLISLGLASRAKAKRRDVTEPTEA